MFRLRKLILGMLIFVVSSFLIPFLQCRDIDHSNSQNKDSLVRYAEEELKQDLAFRDFKEALRIRLYRRPFQNYRSRLDDISVKVRQFSYCNIDRLDMNALKSEDVEFNKTPYAYSER